MANYKSCQHYDVCEYRIGVGSCPNGCVQYRKREAFSFANNLSNHQCNIILAIAEASMNITKACEIYPLAQPSMYYQIKRIKELTGKDPRNFYDLCDLVRYAKREREEE